MDFTFCNDMNSSLASKTLRVSYASTIFVTFSYRLGFVFRLLTDKNMGYGDFNQITQGKKRSRIYYC